MTGNKTVRCAIYTRKSTEEGLEKEFNSLDAQRDACAAYTKSQVGEGWKVLPAKYDDGGFTGANIDRPALQQLLADIDQGLVDVVVVYKIDRLTRSLADFAKIVERFDARGVSFVSITQAFNTTTSMGRLTLNVLLSFAQFEREVTAERIRDKIAASRAKGMWMGGGIPLGYDVQRRKLVINDVEAETVRTIFKRYLELGSIAELRTELEVKGLKTKNYISSRGNKVGGSKWYVGPLRHVLRNAVYIGLAVHKGQSFAGQHDAIIPNSLFDQVQAKLTRNTRDFHRRRTIDASGLLTGLIFDDKGNRMSPQWSVGRSKTKHGYYVSQALLQRRKDAAGSLPRVSAPLIDEVVLRCVSAVNDDQPPRHLSDGDRASAPSSHDRQELSATLRTTVTKVTVKTAEAIIDIRDAVLSQANDTRATNRIKRIEEKLPAGAILRRIEHGYQIAVRGSLKRLGGIKRIEGWNWQDWSAITPRHDKRLLTALGRAHTWREAIELGQIKNIEALADRDQINRRQLSWLVRLAFLAPDIQKAILEGRQPADLNLKRFSKLTPPASWKQQRAKFGLGS